jgi:hypothetical protein
MKEFAHSSGEYRDWKGDESRRKQFLSDLAKTVLRNTNRDFSLSAFLAGYRAVDAQFEFHERVGHLYGICAIQLIRHVQDWMAKTHPRDDVMFVFEKGDYRQEEVLLHLRRDKLDLGIEPIFMEKRWTDKRGVIHTVPALECADFLAYEHHKTMTDVYAKHKKKARGSMAALLGDGRFFKVPNRANTVLDGGFFESAAHSFHLPRRPGVPKAEIPRELIELKEILGDHFHGTPIKRVARVPWRGVLPRLHGD